MSLINTIANNPDFAAVVTAGLGYVGRLLWKKGKDAQINDLWDTLLQLGRQAFPLLLRDKRLYDDAHVRETVSKAIWSGLTRLSVPKNATTMKLVDEAVEHVVGELAAKVVEYHFSRLVPKLEETAEALRTANEGA
jgi:hypothetical protein